MYDDDEAMEEYRALRAVAEEHRELLQKLYAYERALRDRVRPLASVGCYDIATGMERAANDLAAILWNVGVKAQDYGLIRDVDVER